jgi:YD repeat-containing protein
MGWARTKLDRLRRPVELAHFSGSTPPSPWGSNFSNTGAATTSYVANVTSSSTAAAVSTPPPCSMKPRIPTSNSLDAAGRLIQVNEGGLYNTSYAYDALDNLTSVSQSGQTRSFTYTSLSRLLCATNPEKSQFNASNGCGSITDLYAYNGNVIKHQDARVTTNYSSYDGLNRVTGKSYTDGVTPSVKYCYDGGNRGLSRLSRISPVENHPAAVPTVKQHLAAIRMLFDFLVTGQVVPTNPAASVRGPKHVVHRGKTPVLKADQVRTLIDSIKIESIIGLRDRAIIGLMCYTGRGRDGHC